MQYTQHNRRRRKAPTTTRNPITSKVEHALPVTDADPVVVVTETSSIGSENREADESGRYLYVPPTSSRR